MMVTAPKGRTALLDAIYLGLSQMRGAHNAKRALLILSDGGDNHSRYNENDIKRLVKEADTQLYAIGIYDPLGYRNRTPEELNGPNTALRSNGIKTGGRVFAVEHLNELPDIASKIGMELRNQYVLGYKPSNHIHDARWRKIKVKLRAPKGLPPLSSYSKNRILRSDSLKPSAGFLVLRWDWPACCWRRSLRRTVRSRKFPFSVPPPPPPGQQEGGVSPSGGRIKVDVKPGGAAHDGER